MSARRICKPFTLDEIQEFEKKEEEIRKENFLKYGNCDPCLSTEYVDILFESSNNKKGKTLEESLDEWWEKLPEKEKRYNEYLNQKFGYVYDPIKEEDDIKRWKKEFNIMCMGINSENGDLDGMKENYYNLTDSNITDSNITIEKSSENGKYTINKWFFFTIMSILVIASILLAKKY